MITRLYAFLLHLYPHQFRDEFGAEMQTVFEESVASQGKRAKLSFLLREMRDFPSCLLDAYLNNWLRGGNMSMSDEYISPSTRWQALLGTLPFLAFGISSMIGKVNPLHQLNLNIVEIAVYGLALVGLLVGWIRGFPLWSYSYLGWSLLFVWSNTNVSINGVHRGYQVWIPFGITVLIALIWTRSLIPIKKFLQNIWNDWTHLTFVMYTIGAFVAMSYDENHHPYLLLLMAVTNIIIILGAWFFLRSSNLKGRVLTIVVSYIASMVTDAISWLTWDWHAYYGLPKSEHWYENWGGPPILVLFWLMFLFWPAIIALIQRIARRRTV